MLFNSYPFMFAFLPATLALFFLLGRFAARDVAKRFEQNFQQFESHVDSKVKKAAIRAAA